MEKEGAFGGFDELGFFLFEKARRARVFGFSVFFSISVFDLKLLLAVSKASRNSTHNEGCNEFRDADRN